MLSFLNTLLIASGNKIIFNWYHKTTFSGRYLNFFSTHPLSHKISTIIGMVDKVILLSHSCFHTDNFKLIIEILLSNNYLLNLIFNISLKIESNIYQYLPNLIQVFFKKQHLRR